MKTWIATLGACLLLAACGRQEDPRINQLENQVAAARNARAEAEAEIRRLNDRIRDLQDELQEVEERSNELRAEANNAGNDGEIERLGATIDEQKTEIERLNERIKQLEAKPEAETENTEEPTEPREEPEKLTPEQIERKMAELTPLLRAGDSDALNDLMDTTRRADRETRDELIQRIRDWVTEEPENKRARLALATLLTTRFQDLDNPMQQGALAGEVKEEIEKATDIDPDYYEAWHFLAILKVNYPTFAPEFKEADKDLDKALELQKNIAWEARFADIYSAYSIWHRKQEQLDDAAGWVRKGLDKAPRNEGLLTEQKAVEEARTAEEE